MSWNLPRALAAQTILIAAVLGIIAAAGWPPDALSETLWWRPFWVAQAGIFAGSLAILWLRDHPSEAEAAVREGRRIDLVENHALVVAQLKQLETERHKMNPGDYDRERANLLAVGAAALRELDDARAALSVHTPTPNDTVINTLRSLRDADPVAFQAALAELGLRPAVRQGLPDTWRGVFGTLAIVALVGALWWGASADSRSRAAGAPITGGDSVRSGEPAMADQAAPSSANDPVMRELTARLESNPKDLATLNMATERALAIEDMRTAMDMNTRALQVDPQDRDARTYGAVMFALIGRGDEALVKLGEILKEDPKHYLALVYSGLLTGDTDPAGAVAFFERAIEIEDSPQLREALARAKAAMNGQPTPAAPTAAPATPTLYASGTLTLDGSANPNAILFLSLRDPAGGPPLAATRLPAAAFPLDFELTEANRLPMGGQRPMPDHVVLTARLDSDGDPLTRPDTDPSASLSDLPVGSSGLTLALKPGGAE